MPETGPIQIGFPPPLLGTTPQRLNVLAQGEDWIALEKPPGVAVSFQDWEEKGILGLTEALVTQIRAEKPELKRMGLDWISPVFALDSEMSGMALFARTEDAAKRLRNSLGSKEFSFTFTLLARSAPDLPTEITCDLPLAKHQRLTQIIVSHTTGKMSETTFQRGESAGPYHLWTARTHYPRLHQVRVHAHESGIMIPGDKRYGAEPLPLLSAIKKGYRGDPNKEQPLGGQIALHLSEVSWPGSAGEIKVQVPLPKKFTTMIKLISEHAQPYRFTMEREKLW